MTEARVFEAGETNLNMLSGPLSRIVKVPGFVSAYAFTDNGDCRILRENEVRDWCANTEGWLWIHLNLIDQQVERWVAEQLSLRQTVVKSFMSSPKRPNIEAVDGGLVGHLTSFRHELESDSGDFAWMYFMLVDRILLTGRTHAIQSAEKVRSMLSKGIRPKQPAELLALLVTAFLDTAERNYFAQLDELEVIEDRLLEERFRDERRRLGAVRREVARTWRHIRGLRRAIVFAERNIQVFPSDIAMLGPRLAVLDSDFEGLEQRSRFFHDEIDAKLASETNHQLYTLSVLTAAFLPPTLIAGLFGMNVDGIPFTHSSLAFWLAMLACFASTCLVLIYLRLSNR